MNHASTISQRNRNSLPPVMPRGRLTTRNRGNRAALLEGLESRVLLTSVGPAASLFIDLQPVNGYVNTSNGFALEVEVHDSNGNIVTTDTSKLTISIASGPGRLSGTTTVSAVAGIADFDHFIFSKVGTYTLTVSDGGLTDATTNPIQIDAAPKATTLAFGQQPTGNPTGATVTSAITVQVIDQYGNPFTTPTQVVLKLLSGPNKGKVSGTLHAKSVGGIATFSTVTVNAGGTYVLRAMDQSLRVDSNSFVMGGPPVATTLVFGQQPSDAVAGVSLAPAVTVLVDDQYGNLLVTDHSTVKLTVATGPTSKQTFTAPIKSGIATFSKLQYITSGNYTLSATDGSTMAAVSNSFAITANVATHLAFSEIPANGASSSNPGNISVVVVDKYNNVVRTDTSTINLVYAGSPKGIAPLSTSLAATAGVATFNALIFPLAGKYRLRASDGLLVGVTSGTFTLI